MPPARVTAATTSRQWLNAKIGNSRPSSSARAVRIFSGHSRSRPGCLRRAGLRFVPVRAIVRTARAKVQHVLPLSTLRPMAKSRTARRPGTRAAETAQRRRRLLEAATDLAAEGGYEAVQMRDVAARAEVALGTLYRHYSSKDQLLLAALAEQAGTLRDRLQSRPPRGESPADRVGDALRRACRALEREPRVIAAMMTAMSAPDEQAVALKQDVDLALRGIITSAIDGTGDDAVADLDDVVRVLGSVWFAGLSFWVHGMSDAAQMADNLDTAVHLILRERA